MRVLWFTDNSAVGANSIGQKSIGSSWVLSLEEELSKMQDVELGVAFTCNKPDVSDFRIGSSRYFPISIKPVTGKFRKFIYRWIHKIENEEYIKSYLDIIQLFEPDIVHIFGSEHAFGLLIPRTKVPCIIHLQGNLTVINLKWFSGLTALDVFKYSAKWHLIKGHGIFHAYYINKNASEREKEIFLNCNFFMGRTDWDRRISSVLSPNSKYFHCEEILRPGFYLFQWKPRKVQNDYTIISTFRNNIYKGLETIYLCKKILQQYFPATRIVWKIAGISIKDEISCLVERRYKDKFEDIGVKLLGPLFETALIEEMLGADLYVHASHTDNSPNSVCEAMLLGMPVIATYAGGTPSIISDKIEGLLVPDGDPYALAGAIIELLKDAKLAISLGANARKRSSLRNNPEKIISEVMKVYSSVLSGK